MSSSTVYRPNVTPAIRQIGIVLKRGINERLGVALALGMLMIGMGLLVGALWPPLSDTFDALSPALLDNLEKAFSGADLTTPVSWTNVEFLSIVAPGGVIAIAIISGSLGIAGEEERKTLDVLLSMPMSRRTFLIGKTIAMFTHIVIVTAGLAFGFIAGSAVGNLNLTAAGIFGTCAHACLLGAFFGMVTVLTCAATGRRRFGARVAAGIAGLAFFVSTFFPLVDALNDFTRISPWYYFNGSNPLLNGHDGAHLLILAFATVVVFIPSIRVYDHRDLRG